MRPISKRSAPALNDFVFAEGENHGGGFVALDRIYRAFLILPASAGRMYSPVFPGESIQTVVMKEITAEGFAGWCERKGIVLFD